MGIENRDWFWEDRKKREQEYGGDFSLHSKKVKKPSASLSNKAPNQTEKIEGKSVSNIVTIAMGFLLFGAFKAGFFIPRHWNNEGYNVLWLILKSGCCFALGIFLFVRAARRRKGADKGLLNAIALIVSMLIFAFMAVLLFYSICIFL